VALLAGFPVIPGIGDHGERGKRKRMTKRFDFRAYRWLGLTEVARIEAGRDGGGVYRGGGALLPCRAKLGGDRRQRMHIGAEARLQGATARRTRHF
jgi:hypothetical protein